MLAHVQQSNQAPSTEFDSSNFNTSNSSLDFGSKEEINPIFYGTNTNVNVYSSNAKLGAVMTPPATWTELAGQPSPSVLPTAMPLASEMTPTFATNTAPTAAPSSARPATANVLAFALVSTAVCVLWLLEWNYFAPLRGKSKSEPPIESHDVESAIPKSGTKSEDLKKEVTPKAKKEAVDENVYDGCDEGDNGYGFFEVIDLSE